MTPVARHAPRGFTLVEVALVTAIGALVVLTGLQLVSGASGLAGDTRGRARLAAHHRAGVEQIGWLLRSAASITIVDTGIPHSSRLRFVRVADAVAGAPSNSAELTLEWVAVPGTVVGVQHPGLLRLSGPTGTEVVVEQVPRGGFEVSAVPRGALQTYVVRLTTYLEVPEGGETVTMTTESVVLPRNQP